MVGKIYSCTTKKLYCFLVFHVYNFLCYVGETEETLCVAKGQGGGHDSICLLLQPLNAGDEVYVKFRGNGQVILSKCFFHATYLYKYE